MNASSGAESRLEGQEGNRKGDILVVDDKRAMSDLLVLELEDAGYGARAVDSATAALETLDEALPDVIVTDLRMPGPSGIDLCREVVRLYPELPVIVMTAFGSMDVAIEAIRAGAYDFIVKPFEFPVLQVAIDRALTHRRMRAEIHRLRNRVGVDEFEGMQGVSAPMRRLYALIERVGPTDAAILLSGESGTGKELIARALHQRSLRSSGPFVAINCAAMPENLLESELFGHERGAFTSAQDRRRGLLRAAHRGTLFLDEIGDMPLAVQPKLLRVLQEGRFRSVGSDREETVDVRLISASHHDLERKVADGEFRADLFFRLAVVRIDVPPLRERGDDVLVLAEHFLASLADRRGITPPVLSSEADARLRSYPWPGNVRELRNWMEHALALCDGDTILPEHLPRPLQLDREVAPPSEPSKEAEVEGEALESLSTVERRHILRVLEAVGGNKTRAAKILGIDRKTLLARLSRRD